MHFTRINFLRVLVDIILNETEKSSVLNKLLSDRLNRQSFIIKSIVCSQEGDKIIHGLKRKTKGPFGVLRNR